MSETQEASPEVATASGRRGESPMIEADHLSKFYGIFAATRDVSFNVYKGEVVAFLGPNGAGKSTTMKMLTGYLSPSEGVARIAGFDMSTDRMSGSKKLGYSARDRAPLHGHDAVQPAGFLFGGARHEQKDETGPDRKSSRHLFAR